MQPRVLVIGRLGADRLRLEERLREMGHAVVGAEPLAARELIADDAYGLVVIDDRVPGADWRTLVSELAGDSRPLVLISDRPPTPLASGLRGRPGALLAMSGRETDAGWRVALRLCSRLRRRPRVGAPPGRVSWAAS
jgi:CheY-like chemotaxis protein